MADRLMVAFWVDEEPGCYVGSRGEGLFPWDRETVISSLSSFTKCPGPSTEFASHLDGKAAVEQVGP